MRLSCLFPLVALLAGCPTPPEAGPQGGNQSNNGGPNNGGPNNGGPNNGGPNNGGPNNGGPGGEGGGPGGPGGEGGGPGGPGGEGGGPGGEGGGPGGEGGGPGGEGGGPGGEGGGPGGEGGGPGGEGGANNAGPSGGAPSDQAKGEAISKSILIQYQSDNKLDPDREQAQAEIKAGEHVTFSGVAVCDGCTETLVLRAVPFVGPDDKPDDTASYTTMSLSGAGAFSIAIPTSETPMVLELMVDADGNGIPTKGERFAVLEMGGMLIPSQDRGDLELDVSQGDFDIPLPPPAEGEEADQPEPDGQDD